MQPFLFFDIGDVLVDIDFTKCDVAWLHYIPALTKPEHVKELFLQEPVMKLINQYSCGQVETFSFTTQLTKLLGYQGTSEFLLHAFSNIFSPMPQRVAYMNKLITQHQHQVALISDNDPAHVAYLEVHFPEIFENIPPERRFYSHIVGIQKKTGPEIYRHACDAVKVNPCDALMIDDRIQNKAGADAIGLPFLLLNKQDDLEKALIRHAL